MPTGLAVSCASWVPIRCNMCSCRRGRRGQLRPARSGLSGTESGEISIAVNQARLRCCTSIDLSGCLGCWSCWSCRHRHCSLAQIGCRGRCWPSMRRRRRKSPDPLQRRIGSDSCCKSIGLSLQRDCCLDWCSRPGLVRTCSTICWYRVVLWTYRAFNVIIPPL